jgi:hypothetical protein
MSVATMANGNTVRPAGHELSTDAAPAATQPAKSSVISRREYQILNPSTWTNAEVKRAAYRGLAAVAITFGVVLTFLMLGKVITSSMAVMFSIYAIVAVVFGAIAAINAASRIKDYEDPASLALYKAAAKGMTFVQLVTEHGFQNVLTHKIVEKADLKDKFRKETAGLDFVTIARRYDLDLLATNEIIGVQHKTLIGNLMNRYTTLENAFREEVRQIDRRYPWMSHKLRGHISSLQTAGSMTYALATADGRPWSGVNQYGKAQIVSTPIAMIASIAATGYGASQDRACASEIDRAHHKFQQEVAPLFTQHNAFLTNRPDLI